MLGQIVYIENGCCPNFIVTMITPNTFTLGKFVFIKNAFF